MGKREIGGALVSAAALAVAWLLPVTFPGLHGWGLAAVWIATALVFGVGLWLIFHRPAEVVAEEGLKAPVLEAEAQKRAQRGPVLRQITQLYILSHDGISPRMMAGMELPPEEFINAELERQGATWRVRNVNGETADTYDI